MLRGGILQLLHISRAFRAHGWTRDLHCSRASLFPNVVVPPLGESISEGSVAAIVAQKGQSIKVDDVIAQLETDKVTIDCKSAHAGTLEQIKVKVGDVVKPGSVIAIVGGSAPQAPPKQQQQPSVPSPTTSPQPKPPPSPKQKPPQPSTYMQKGAEAETSGRKPMISFPPRVAPNGRRISDLPASEADKVLEEQQQQQQQQQGPGEQAPPTAQVAMMVGEAPIMPIGVTALQPASPPTQPLAGVRVSEATLYLDQMPLRRGPTRSEMEAINSGGADF